MQTGYIKAAYNYERDWLAPAGHPGFLRKALERNRQDELGKERQFDIIGGISFITSRTSAMKQVMNEQEETKAYKREVVKRYATQKLTTVPVGVGLAGLAASWLFSSPLLFIGGLTILVLGIAGLVSRYLSEDNRIENDILKQMKAKAKQRTQAYLDDLEKVLAITPDPRDEKALRELRGLLTAFHENGAWERSVDETSAINIRLGVERLFKSAVKTLRESYNLLVQSQNTQSTKVREAHLKRREMLITEVQESVHRMENMFEQLQTMRPLEETGEDLAALRDELDNNLKIALEVAEGTEDWDNLERHDLSDL